MTVGRVSRWVNWRYAVGETALIVVGVVVALAVADWNERRIERQQELALLAEVRASLDADLGALISRLASVEETVSSIETLNRLLADGRSGRAPTDAEYGAVYGIHTVVLNTAAYETLKSSGLHRVSDPELRRAIGRLFDERYEQLEQIHALDNNVVLGLLRPYYLENFQNIVFLKNATPRDAAFVRQDPYFANLVAYRLTVLQANQAARYPQAIAEIRALEKLLDAELARGKR